MSISSLKNVWEIFSDVFDSCYPDLLWFAVSDINSEFIMIDYDGQKTIVPFHEWNKMNFKEKTLMKLGLIHKILDEKNGR